MTSEKGNRKDKNQNIQVFVRLRPLNQRERDIKSLGVIEVANHREVIVRQSQNSSHTKKFTFDRAFGPNAKQVEVYHDVVSPLIEEVLAGYNCTVFAYGQTGTGKTHTMVGESTGDEISWQDDPLAGIVPRALSQLFDELRLSNTEYTVRVSYLELYNEELFDLLASSEDNSKLRIYEDVTRKGSNIVNGLEEITVSNKNEVYKIMSQGQERKRVASTLMNAQSSRSHTVFTIVVHMRENSPEGEELVKIGKLNLVDLAGSENISKAGSDNPAKRERARECVNINQSLLTLGRVITALVERHPHIPYRESKLTRILQESLGGRTKTSIIATISPGHKDLEETMSTLEYAHRAKNIQNKPEVNQKMTKRAILKEYAEEIDRLKRDLQASRDKNGVYLATDTYTELTLKQEEQRKEIQDLLLQKRAVEEQREKVETMFRELNTALEGRDSELTRTKDELSTTRNKLTNTKLRLGATKAQFEEQKYLVEQVAHTEEKLTAQARELLTVASVATDHVHCLHDTVDKRRNVECNNLQVTASFRSQAAQHRATIAHNTQHHALALADGLATLHAAIDEFATNNASALQGNKGKLEVILQQMQDTMNEIRILTNENQSKLVASAEMRRGEIRACVSSNGAALHDCVRALLHSAAHALQAARATDVPGNVATFVRQWYGGAAARVSSLCETQRSFIARMEQHSSAQIEAANVQRNNIVARKEQKDALVHALNEKIERDSTELEKRLSEQLEQIEAERSSTRERLEQWVKEQLRVFTQQLEQHVDSETRALDERLSKRIEEIELERSNLQHRHTQQLQLQERLLEANAHETHALMHELQLWETSRTEQHTSVQGYHKDFHEGTSAISTDMEVFSSNVVEVVDHIYQQLLKTMELANQHTAEETQSVVSKVETAGNDFIVETDAALDDIVSTNKQIVDDMLLNMQAKSSTSTDTVTDVSASLSALASSSAAQRAAHHQRVRKMSAQLALLEDSVCSAVLSLERVEGRCLADEYKVYSPTGKTPSRMEYRYPRALHASSPHHRIVARFRAMREHAQDDDCVLIESDVESRASDGESSVSEDSSLFAAPTPPAPTAPAAPTPRNHTQPNMVVHRNTNIVKCTSETDIYDIKRDQDGKENANRSINYKKPSKLPAPSSIKKPFVERNGIDN